MDEDRVLDKLDSIENQNRQMLVALTQVQEQVRVVPDHENRLRTVERWRYGLPMTGLVAIVSATVSAWTATKGGN